MKNQTGTMKNHENRPGAGASNNVKNRHGTMKNQSGTMKNQSGTIKTNLELDRVVMGGSGGYRGLPGGSAHFSLQTNRQTLHHKIYIIIIIISAHTLAHKNNICHFF